jgi:hypothetical protein
VKVYECQEMLTALGVSHCVYGTMQQGVPHDVRHARPTAIAAFLSAATVAEDKGAL